MANSNNPPSIPAPSSTPSTLDALRKNRSFYPSTNFVIGCGCVLLDPTTRKILLIYNLKHGIYQLPKGRKDIGEDLLSAALRETFEESGYEATPLPLRLGTRATPTVVGAGGEDVESVRPDVNPGVTEAEGCLEPVAVTHWMEEKSGVMKMVFYFVATGDEGAVPKEGGLADWEKLRSEWVPAEEAAGRLFFPEDGRVVTAALEAVRKSGLDV